MAKITFWAAGTDDGCTFYRCTEPARVLADRGHDATAGQGHGYGELLTSDVVVIARPTEVETLAFMRMAKRNWNNAPRLVVELDDDLFAVPEHFGELHATLAEPERRARLRECLHLADRITVTNEHLVNRVIDEALCGRPAFDIRVVPNYVPERYVVDAPPQLNGTVTIGWAGSWTHAQDVRQIVEPVRRVLAERDDVRFHAVGHNFTHDIARGLPGGFTDNGNRLWYTRWRDGVDNHLRSLDFHIGLAPLDDDLFNRSKSDVKLKEYAARGIVPVASHVGPYANTDVPSLRVGRAHPLSEPWPVWLDHLTCEPHRHETIATVAESALEWARANTLERHASQWEDALLKGSDQ